MFGDRRVGHAMLVKCVGHAMLVVVIVISLIRDTSSYLTLRLLLKISGSNRSPFSTLTGSVGAGPWPGELRVPPHLAKNPIWNQGAPCDFRIPLACDGPI